MEPRAHLVPCPACSRHVRSDESTCPFCHAAINALGGSAPARPSGRLSRAALFALGTGAAVLGSVVAIDCSDGDDSSSNCCPPYGASPPQEFDAAEFEQDSALTTADVHVGSADAGDSSVSDAGAEASDAVADGG
jgi:hypothetical protein